MSRILHPASGTGRFCKKTVKVIRFVKKGCTNRPFFHITVAEKKRRQQEEIIEQLGSYDPLPNQHGEKLVSLNIERIMHWMGHGVQLSRPISQLFGLSGLLPIHPTNYMVAWRNREAAEKLELEKQEAERKEAEKKEEPKGENEA